MVAHVPPPSLSAQEFEHIASLHRSELPTSILGMMGASTLTRYYRWAAATQQEHLFLAGRNANITGVAVVSLAPTTLISRFVRSSPVRFCIEAGTAYGRSRTFRKQALAFAREDGSESGDQGEPELMQIFIAAEARGRAVGSGLLSQVEHRLRALGVRSYLARTLAENNEATLAFYERRGFAPFGRRSFCGQEYVFLRKSLAA